MNFFSGLPPAAAAFLVAQVSAVSLVLLALMMFLAADDPWVRGFMNRRRSRLPILRAAEHSSEANPIRRSVPGCRRCGEIFWNTRLGTLMLCRLHARRFREHLDEFFQTMEHG